MLLDADPLVSFAWIMGAALLAPLLSYATGKRLPAVVLLICFGLVIGPNVLGLASLDGGVGLIKEIGLGMLFLLAGYKIEPETLRGKEGRTGLATWLMCAVLSFLGAMSIVGFHSSSTAIVLAIALTSTAIGTLLPIMKQHDMLDTPVGRSLLIHGAIGEIAPDSCDGVVVVFAFDVAYHGCVVGVFLGCRGCCDCAADGEVLLAVDGACHG